MIGRISLLFALIILNGSLTLLNRWPTPAVEWNGAVSVEVALALLTLAGWSRLHGRPSRPVVRGLAALFVWFTICRYLFVTAPALYGRDVSLYWDVRFLPDVTRMLVHAAPAWAVALVVTAIVAAMGSLYLVLLWAWRTVANALADARLRNGLSLACVALVVAFAAEQAGHPVPGLGFTTTLSRAYYVQLRDLRDALTQSKAVPASPPMDSDLSRLGGSDVLLVFMESYGAVSYDRPEMATRLEASRAQFLADLGVGDRQVVSAFVESPTFGGNSWLAHATLQSGVEVKDEDRYFALLGQTRDTMPKAFVRHGYRAVGLMPGLKYEWPEGGFYGYTEIYNASRLPYEGPAFGWFTLPDQWTLARFDALESGRADRQPLFVVFPTLSTHTPFMPVPPYQPDWDRVLSPQPFDAGEADRALAREPDWFNLGASYVEAVAYDFAVLGGYLRRHADRDLVMIVIGDHQPPAVVSGEGQPWDVPVHVIASRPEVLDRLVRAGFAPGLTPARPHLGRMHELLPVLFDAFGDRPTSH